MSDISLWAFSGLIENILNTSILSINIPMECGIFIDPLYDTYV
jgi:hypothetical protein